MTSHPVRAELWLGGVWVDVSKRLRRRSPVTVSRGRADELSQVTPSQIGMVLSNTDGALTPRNPESPWYPDWARGTECRVWVDGATPALIVPGVTGANATTPDNAALDITGTITVVARLDPEAWAGNVTYVGGLVTGGNTQRIANKWATSNRSWQLYMYGPGWLAWEWSTDGTSGTGGFRQSSKVVAAQKPLWVGATFRPNNGAGGNTVVWWTSEDGVTFTELASETVAGTTSIFSGNATLKIGTIDPDTPPAFEGRVLAARVINGELAGTVVANPDFTTQAPGTRSFTDAAGRVWSVNGSAEIATRTIRGVGHVDEIDVDWPIATARDHPTHEGVAHVAVTASGMLRRLGQGAKPVASALSRKITSDSVTANIKAYWPLEDGSGSVRASSPITGVSPMGIGGDTWRFAADSTLLASAPLPHVSGDKIYFGVQVPPYTGSQSRVDVFARIDTAATTANTTIITSVQTNGTARRWTLGIDDTNVRVTAIDIDSASIVSQTFASNAAMFGGWTWWTFNIEQDAGNIDWALTVKPLSGTTTYGMSNTVAGTVGQVTSLHNWGTVLPPDGISFGHMVVSTGLGDTWLSTPATAFVGETAARRFWRLCVEEDIPVHVIGDPSVSDTTMGDPSESERMGPQGRDPLIDLLKECAETDGGIMSEHRSAMALDYRTRKSLYNQAAALTLDVNTRGVSREFRPVEDDQRYCNDVTATSTVGSFAHVTTNPAPEPGDLHETEIRVNPETDLQLPDLASWHLHRGVWPAMRYPGLGISLRTAGIAVARRWADLALGDRVKVDNLPRQHDKTVDVILEGYTETLSFFDWTASINASPEGPWHVGIREDEVLGVRDTGGSELAASFAAGTATTMSVETTAGPLWAVTAASNSALPFDVEVGGAQVTVTAIGAAAGQVQTFTVTAATGNGVTKTVAAGTAVRLWSPARRAL